MAKTGTNPDIPDRKWSNPFAPGTPLHGKFQKVVRQNRDLIILIDDMNGRRGTGKTVASLQLAAGMDQTDEGLISEKVSMDPEAVREAYATQPKQSSLVLDEGEVGASNRQAMSKTNQALREIMSMGRVEEKYVVVNTPIIDFIDKDIRKLADVWISMQRKGEGLVHFLERQPYANKLLTPKKQHIEFDDIPRDDELRSVYNELTREKRSRIRGGDGDGYILRKEHEKIVSQKVEKAKKEIRDELIEDIYHHPKTDLSQTDLADVIGITQPQVSKIVKRDIQD